MRVIAGSAGSVPLIAPKGVKVRPTADRLKENLFNLLGPRIPGARFLDLYSGSGAIGIEALSRGAREAVFVENSRAALEAIRVNLRKCGLDTKARVLGMDIGKAIRRLTEEAGPFDIIFLDPPYGMGLTRQTLTWLEESSLLAAEGMIVAEVPAEEAPLVSVLTPYDERVYGGSKFVFWRLT